MNNTSVNDSIQLLLKELKSLIEDMKVDPSGTSQLELDLTKGKIRAIYDMLYDVKIITEPDQPKEVETITHPEPELKPAQEKIEEPEPAPELILQIEPEVEENVDNSATTETEKQTPPPSEPILNLFEEPATKPDENEKKSVGEKIAEQKSVESIGEVIQSKKTVNLKLAIGINEKFFLLNELFEGKMNEYNDTIEILDQKDTFKDAMEYLALLKENKNWDEESEAFLQLKGFLERKFN